MPKFEARGSGLPYGAAVALAAVMGGQSLLGLLYPHAYRDVEWIRATWHGNDWVTLLLGVPALTIAVLTAARGSTRGQLVWLGMLAYAAYNYAFYTFGAALNVFFLLYVIAFVLAVATLVLMLARLDVGALAGAFEGVAPLRLVSLYLMLVGTGLAVAWIALWAAYAFWGHPTPVEPEEFKLVAALDLGLMVPALMCGGVLSWRRRPWGYAIATIASIQASLYLVVLSVNAAISIHRGLIQAPGELPLWVFLAAMTTTASLLLLVNVREGRRVSSCA
jgi:hypothetical protein